VDGASALDTACRAHDVLAIYLFGSRAGDGMERLAGRQVAPRGSDLDVGVVFLTPHLDHRRLSGLQVALEDVFEPLRVDLVPLQRVDALFQFAAISGHRVFESDPTRVAEYELLVMRRAAELQPIQRLLEREVFGFGGRP
jgi:predicted nucleotidyltransferase